MKINKKRKARLAVRVLLAVFAIVFCLGGAGLGAGFGERIALAADAPQNNASVWQRAKNALQSIKNKITGQPTPPTNTGFQGWTNMLENMIKNYDPADPKNNQTKEQRESNEIRQWQQALDREYAGSGQLAANRYAAKNKERLDEITDKTKQYAAQENGSARLPYKIEPNQFKKVCDKNEYILYNTIGGMANRDMMNPVATGGAPTGEESQWRLPTCSELAQCHCCINTCDDTVWRIVRVKGGTLRYIVCLPNVGFGAMPCGPMCKAPVARMGCSSFTGGAHGEQNDRDCMGRANGCEDSGGCTIKIYDPGYSQFEYTNPPESERFVKSKPGMNIVPPGAKIKKDNGKDVFPIGFIGQLKRSPGQCCKCIQR
ncbi:MAG: hypothetical protein FJZ04_02670 [Candidatus Moranbacteria bacterium]|nr:hypothetical protein [Candidatus Moranbacteria bacterium]